MTDDIYNRPSWESYFMGIAFYASKRSTCKRRAVGCVISKDKRILSTGYNGAPSNLKHCVDVGCLREKMNVPSGQRHELCRGIHAEQNAIIQAAYHGVSINGGKLFCTNLPCSICTKMIINAGIIEVYYSGDYSDPISNELFLESGIKIIHYSKEDNCEMPIL